jgi:hypothetical protein
LRLIYCAGGTAVHMRPIFRYIDPLCVSKSASSILALPLGSLRSLKSDRLLDQRRLDLDNHSVNRAVTGTDANTETGVVQCARSDGPLEEQRHRTWWQPPTLWGHEVQRHENVR